MNICLETLVMENNKNNSKLHPHDEWNKSIYQHTILAVKKFIKNIFINSNNNK